MPTGPWVGLAALDPGRLVLAGADQRLRVLDVETGRPLAEFPAVVPPSRRVHFGECTALAAGRDWITALDPLRALLHLTAADGTPLATLPLAPLLGAPGDLAVSIAASRDHLGIGVANRVLTFAVEPAPECAG